MFETNEDVLTWYEKQPRALTQKFIDNINWKEVGNFPLNKKFIPVLLYMRDVETFTDIYYAHLRRTPTGKNPTIKRFMERWGEEELVHGELLNRFLNEAGYPTSDKWIAEAKAAIPRSYKVSSRLTTILTNCVGKSFTAAHMTYGAINEISTLQGYRRLIQLAEHPVLTRILTAVMREESVHAQFYWNVARLELQRSEFAQRIARFAVRHFWVPVGQGAKTAEDANYTIAALFSGRDGIECFENNVSRRIRTLPGFGKLDSLTDRIASVCLST